jgi:antirestriction protein ArdC
MSKAYALITDKVLEALDKGTVPWRKPWAGEPTSLQTGKVYRGINYLLLGCAPYGSPFWATYKQAQQRGGQVRKGEKSWPCVFWKWLEREGDDGKARRFPLLRFYRVFNSEQCDGLELPEMAAATRENAPIDAAETIWANMPQRPAVVGSARACYSPQADNIGMPAREMFDASESYYSVLFHEATHSTGHESRLDRDTVRDSAFGTHDYSKEELVAEMGAAFLCGHAGIDGATLEQSAAYIDGWRRKISKDPKLVVDAAAKAQKAADFILGRSWD